MLIKIDNLTFKYKVMLIIAAPIIAYAYLSLLNINSNYNRYIMMKDTNTLVNIVTGAGDIMHEVQKERALATGFFREQSTVPWGEQAADDEDGEVMKTAAEKQIQFKRFKTELVDRYKVTDESILHFTSKLQDASSFINQKPKLKKDIIALKLLLNKLKNIREKTLTSSIKQTELDHLYAQIDEKAMTLIMYLVTSDSDTEISRDANTLVMLMEIKSLLGQEQVVLGQVFQEDYFSKDLLRQYMTITSNYEIFIGLFRLVSPGIYLDKLDNILQNQHTETINQYRRLVLNTNAVYNIKPADWVQAQSQHMDQIKTIVDQLKINLLSKGKVLMDKASESLMTNSIGIILVLSISIFLIYIVVYKLNKRIQTVITVINALSSGNLNVKIKNIGKDELGYILKNVKYMSEKLNVTVTAVQDAAENIRNVSSEMASQNKKLASRTQESANSLQETSASMEEISSTISLSSDNAQEVNRLGQKANEVAKLSAQPVAEAVKAMKEVNEASGKISAIIEAIEAIAFQTNLLALNAAVEAASAGEHGKGFAVVAQEVRNLSQRSSESAKEIKELIMNTVEKVKKGSELVNKTGAAFNEITESINKVSLISEEVASSAQEQSEGVSQVNEAVVELDHGTQENMSLVENLNQSGEELKELWKDLNTDVAFFTTSKKKN